MLFRSILSAEKPTQELTETLQIAYAPKKAAQVLLKRQQISLADWQGISGFTD